MSETNSNGATGKMQCLLLDSKSHCLNLVECSIPKISSDDEPSVVVKVVLSGLCGTDLHIIEVNIYKFFSSLLLTLKFKLKYI